MIYLVVENNVIVNRVVAKDDIDPAWVPNPEYRSLNIGDVYYPDIGIYLPPNTDFYSAVNSYQEQMQEILSYYENFKNHIIFQTLNIDDQNNIFNYIKLVEKMYTNFLNETDNYKKFHDVYFLPIPNELMARINLESEQ